MSIMKKAVAMVLSIGMIFTMSSVGNLEDIFADDEKNCDLVISQLEYENYALEWVRNENNIFDSLRSVKIGEQTVATYGYDENGNRVYKIVDSVKSQFAYTDDFYLDTVTIDENKVQYLYDFNGYSNIKVMTGFIYCGEKYDFDYDEYKNIVGISIDGTPIVKYLYNSDGTFKSTLRNNGMDWIECKDKLFIGNINKIRYKQVYYDEETGWYYLGRYYDAANGRYVDGICENDARTVLKNIDLLSSSTNFLIYNDNGNQRAARYSNAELICRVLYCEAGSSSGDWDAVAWAVYNRINGTSVTAVDEIRSGAFSAYNNGDYEFSLNNWYNQSKWNTCYNNAVSLNTKQAPSNRPSYINTQKNFRSVNTFLNGYDSDGSTVQYFGADRIYNVAIPENTQIPPSLLYSDLYSKYSYSQGLFNIYFSYWGE